jgi:tRNA (cytidine/uridine-2'-O-)-methyltransferase
MPLLQLALFEPEIPPNTGNIIRLCANCGAKLHLIHPLGFEISNKHMRRAGLDYHEWADIAQYSNYAEFIEKNQKARVIACSTKARTCFTKVHYQANDIFLFGPESRGLPDEIREHVPVQIRIPMLPHSRSLNLSNAAAIICYEAWRQHEFT